MASAAAGLESAVQSIEREPVRSFAQAYDAVNEACNAFMRRSGYRTVAENDHRAVLAYCSLELGREDAATLRLFATAEKRRHT